MRASNKSSFTGGVAGRESQGRVRVDAAVVGSRDLSVRFGVRLCVRLGVRLGVLEGCLGWEGWLGWEVWLLARALGALLGAEALAAEPAGPTAALVRGTPRRGEAAPGVGGDAQLWRLLLLLEC